MEKRIQKLDLPLAGLDDWDLLQAVFEGKITEISPHPGFNGPAILEQEFPALQSKNAQVVRLTRMLSQRNEWGYGRGPLDDGVPSEILEDALKRIQNETRLGQTKTIRALLQAYPETTMPPETPESPERQRFTWTALFYRDFFEFLAEKKIAGEGLLDATLSGGTKPKPQPNDTKILRPLKEGMPLSTADLEGPEQPLQPGAVRTLQALKEASPQGLTIKELGPLTRKDAVADDSPPGSLAPWLKQLKAKGLVQSQGKKTKKWFFVKDCEC